MLKIKNTLGNGSVGKILLAASLGVGVLGGTAVAQADPSQHRHQHAEHVWAQLDRNQDGKATREEASQLVEGRFVGMDTNKDGKVTREELALSKDGAAKHNERFARMDKNRDQRIARDEAAGRLREHFDALDANHDGFLTAPELSAHHAGKARNWQAKGFERLDANKDGAVTRAELTQHWMQRFAEADTNHDGVVARAEFEAVRMQQRQRRPHPKHAK